MSNNKKQGPSFSLDMPNHNNREEGQKSIITLKGFFFWVSTVTSTIGLRGLLGMIIIELLKQVFPEIQTYANNSGVAGWLFLIAVGFSAFFIARKTDFTLIDRHGKIAITEFVIFYRIWRDKKHNPNLGVYQMNISFTRVFTATYHFLLFSLGLSTSFFTSLNGSKLSANMVANDGSETTQKVETIEAEKQKSKDNATAKYDKELAALEKQKAADIQAATAPYQKAIKRANSTALFKRDSIIAFYNKAYSARIAAVSNNITNAINNWNTNVSGNYEKQIEKAKNKDENRDAFIKMFGVAVLYLGTFAVCFGVMSLFSESLHEVDAMKYEYQEVAAVGREIIPAKGKDSKQTNPQGSNPN